MSVRPAVAFESLPESLVDLVAQRFRVLGEPMRIRLLERLRQAPATVTELQHALDASQQNVSKHLAILHAAGMIARTKRGTSVTYAVEDPTVFDLCDLVCGGVRRQLHSLAQLAGPTPGSDDRWPGGARSG